METSHKMISLNIPGTAKNNNSEIFNTPNQKPKIKKLLTS
jgi:hypothetical protein